MAGTTASDQTEHTPTASVILKYLDVAATAMREVAFHAGNEGLDWSDIKTIIIGNRIDAVLNDLDHLMLRVGETTATRSDTTPTATPDNHAHGDA